MPSIDYARLAETFRALALQAGEAILQVRESGGLQTQRKADQSPVTEADLAADRIIREGLARAFPALAVITEETAEESAAKGTERFVLVDPLDGTKEFVRGEGDFTVNLALIEAGVPTRGVVYAPARRRLWLTDADGEAWREDLVQKARTRLRVRVPDPAGLIAVASKSHRTERLEAFLAALPLARSESAGSSLKFCLVAEGRADLYPRLGRTMEWDTAAGHAVLRAAGGLVLTLPALIPLSYGKPTWANPDFLALTPAVDPELIAQAAGRVAAVS